MSVLGAAFDELRLHLVHDVFLLLTHCLTKGIALASSEIGKLACKQHNLLLIDRDAVSVVKVFFASGEIIRDFFQPVLALDELRDVVHRPGSVEGIHGDKVLEDCGMQFLQVLTHACRLELECSDGLAFLI